jgi:hypothetical protein
MAHQVTQDVEFVEKKADEPKIFVETTMATIKPPKKCEFLQFVLLIHDSRMHFLGLESNLFLLTFNLQVFA